MWYKYLFGLYSFRTKLESESLSSDFLFILFYLVKSIFAIYQLNAIEIGEYSSTLERQFHIFLQAVGHFGFLPLLSPVPCDHPAALFIFRLFIPYEI